MVSIIIPCYNYGHFLEQALSSVQQQTYVQFECIVVDDGSTDNTRSVAEKFVATDTRFKYIYQLNRGLSEARNTGINCASGKYIQLLDADDLIEAGKLQQHVEYLESHPESDIVFSDAYSFHTDWHEAKKFQINAPPERETYLDVLVSMTLDNFYLPGCPVFKKSITNEIGFFDGSLRALEDWHFWYRAALAGKRFHRLSEKGTHLLSRSHGFNMSTSQRLMWKNKIEARLKLMSRMRSMAAENKLPLDASSLDSVLQKHHRFLALDKIRYHIWFGNLFLGLGAVFSYAWYGGNVVYGLREGFYCFRQRIKALLKRNV